MWKYGFVEQPFVLVNSLVRGCKACQEACGLNQRFLQFWLFCNSCCWFVKLLNNSLTQRGAFREPLYPSIRTRFTFWGPFFFLCVFLHPLFHHKITFVTKLAPRMVSTSFPNLTMDSFFLISWKHCFGTTLSGFCYIFRFPPSRKGTRSTTKTKPAKDN